MEEKLHHLEQLVTDLRLERERLLALRAEFQLLRADFRMIRNMPSAELNPSDPHITYFHRNDE